MLQRLTDETGIPADGVRDIVFLASSYPGHLAPEEFCDTSNPASGTPRH